MTSVVTEAEVDPRTAARNLEPRDGMVLERRAAPGRFVAAEGPVDHYERTVVSARSPEGMAIVRQTVRFRLAVPWIGWLFLLPARRRLGRLVEPGRMPWWLPPVRMDARAARTLTALAVLALINGYLGTVLTQTVTFAGREFGSGTTAQGWTLSAVRGDALVSLFLVASADRRGRRRVVLGCTAAGSILTGAGALVPSLAWLAATQILARAFVTAAVILTYVIAAEEVPARARAWSASVLVLCSALGAGVCVMLVPLAGLGQGAWRILYAAGMLGALLTPGIARRLEESRRFTHRPSATPPSSVSRRGVHGARLWLLASSSFLLATFLVPATQYLNQYLRTERGFSASRIAIFVLLTSTPGGIGVVVGGRLAETAGRRVVAACALVAGTATSVAYFLTSGWGMWAWAVTATVVSAAAVPALAVYGPELFPTSIRGRANGAILLTNRLGGAAGLVAVGQLSPLLGGIGQPIAVLAIGPLLLAALVIAAYPETKATELETLNPEDRV